MLDKLIDFVLNTLEQILPFYVLHEYEMGILYRFGRLKKVLYPGFQWKIPFVDSISKDIVTTDTLKIEEVNITTLDGKTITISGEFDLIVTDIIKSLNDTHDWRSNLKDISRGIMSNHLEDINWDDIRKKTTKNAIEKRIEKRALEMGVTISNFNFTDKAISRVYKIFNSNPISNGGKE